MKFKLLTAILFLSTIVFAQKYRIQNELMRADSAKNNNQLAFAVGDFQPN